LFIKNLEMRQLQLFGFPQVGISGVRYLDGNSRTANQGTSNFVLFPGNDGLINIVERNGVPVK
jgi:hypothetical protein